MNPYLYLLTILICLILSAFFSGSETALLRLRKEHLEKDIKAAKGPAAFAVRDLLKSPSRLLVTILLGNNLVNIVGAATASALAIYYFGAEKGVLIASVVMTLVILIFSEVLPKALGARDPKGVSYVVGLPMYLIHQVLRPLHFLFDKGIEPIVLKITGGKDVQLNTNEEILAMAKMAMKEKTKGGPLAIISSAAGAADLKVSDIMIPRTEITAFPIDSEPAELLRECLNERYTRFPIYEGTLDKVLGLVHLKDLARLVQEKRGRLGSILKPVLRVPEKKPILTLLREMQKSLIHMAIVKDEFGVTQGIVTVEDILEEIVGEIRDEFDTEELSSLKKLPNNSFEAIGKMYVTDFNRDTGWDLPAERGVTLSGIVFNQLGRAPNIKDEVKVGNYLITVIEVSGTRVGRVIVKKILTEVKAE